MTSRGKTGFAWAVSARDEASEPRAIWAARSYPPGGVELMAPFGGGVVLSEGGMVVVVPGEVD